MEEELEDLTGGRADSAADRAYAYVKERLLNGRYAGGTLLSENELARRLGISRTPVRQAFVQLESEDLLELYPRRGALVRPISASEAEDVLEARLLIEAHCARRVAAYGYELTGKLSAALAEQETDARAGGTGFTTVDRRFHRAIVAANGNAILTRQYDSLRDRQQRISAAAVSHDPARIARFIADHHRIAVAIETGDGEGAAQLIAAHLRSTHDLARRSRLSPRSA